MSVSFSKHKLRPGPIGIIFAEDNTGLNETIIHMQNVGFTNLFVMGNFMATKGIENNDNTVVFDIDPDQENAARDFLNAAIKAFPDRWIFHCFNAEFIFFPFCETRSITDLLVFSDEERRISVAATLIDMYTAQNDPKTHGFAPDDWLFDGSGYYAQYRDGADQTPMRFVETFGGLRWRLEEYFPNNRRRIDRTNLFKAVNGLQMDSNLNGNLPDFGTIGAPWHNSPTIAIASFRAAKYLHINAQNKTDVSNLAWSRSIAFEKSSHQLMEMGFMEPGQWF